MATRLTLWRLLLVLLLAGCRNEKIAFQVGPAYTPTTQLDTANHNNGMRQGTSVARVVSRPFNVATKRPTPTLFRQHNSTQRISASTAGSAHSSLKKQEVQSTFKRATTPLHTTDQSIIPQTVISKKGNVLQLVGTVLAVAGIVIGIAVGGWAGFGLFALLALIGLGFAFWGSFVVDGELP
jgi:hypothetical protein